MRTRINHTSTSQICDSDQRFASGRKVVLRRASNRLFSLTLGFMLFVLVSFSAIGTVSGLESGALLQTPHTLIFYDENTERLARKIAGALEFAYVKVAEDLGFPKRHVRVYIYKTQDKMAEGLMTILGYSQEQASAIATVGISAVTRGTLHVQAKTRQWGPYLWHAVVHEYSHGVLEDRYGSTPELSVRWLYEGLGDYEAHKCLSEKLHKFEMIWHRARFKLVYNSWSQGELPNLREISDESKWLTNIRTSRKKWNIQYATAYVATTYLIDKYGFEKIQDLLSNISRGEPYEKALEKTIGISLSVLQEEFNNFLREQQKLQGDGSDPS